MGRLLGRLWISLREAHEESGIPTSTLTRQCREGKRRCRRIGKGQGRWQVPASDFRDNGRR